MDAWERNVNLTVPDAPLLTIDCRTKYLKVMYSLSIVLKVKSESMRDFRAESIQLAIKFAFLFRINSCWLQVRKWGKRH